MPISATSIVRSCSFSSRHLLFALRIAQSISTSSFQLNMRAMHPVFPVLNLIASAAGATGGLVALFQPAVMSQSSQVTPGELFYARMYAVRAIPFGVVAGLLPFWYKEPVVAILLFTASLVQAADVVIGSGKKDRGMVIGASTATILHFICGYTML